MMFHTQEPVRDSNMLPISKYIVYDLPGAQ